MRIREKSPGVRLLIIERYQKYARRIHCSGTETAGWAWLVNQELVRRVWQRAQGRCEYCRLRASEVRPVLKTSPLACLHCNRHKGPNIAGPWESVRLFHPRHHKWSEHFAWTKAELAARTVIGRVTIAERAFPPN